MDFQLFKPGQRISEKYEVIEKIGQGGYGTVLKVRELDSGKEFALKYCTGGGEDYLRFKREIGILEPLTLPGVIPILDSELNSDPPYYVMPLAEGCLEDLYNQMQIPKALTLFRKVCLGVQGLHSKHIYHRDIKPQNVLIIEGEPYVADFGLARHDYRNTTGLTTVGIGTPEYAAPEQFVTDGTKRTDGRTDIFALAKLLYRLLTGMSPLRPEFDRLPRGLAVIVKKCTADDQDARLPDVRALLDAIDLFDEMSEPVLAPTLAPPEALPIVALAVRDIATALDQKKPDMTRRIRVLWRAIFDDLCQHTPFDIFGSTKVEYGFEDFLGSLERTIPAATAFAVVAEEVAAMGSVDGVNALYRGFECVANRQDLPWGVGGYIDERAFDYWRFIGHEFMAMLFASIVRNDRWELAGIVEEELFVDNGNTRPKFTQPYEYLSESIHFFEEPKNLYGRSTRHGIILDDRHKVGTLAEVSPIDEFREGDYFLGLRSAFLGSYEPNVWRHFWAPHSVGFLTHPPRFLLRAYGREYAGRLLKPLGVADLSDFREKMAKHKGFSARVHAVLRAAACDAQIEPELIGSK